VNYVAIDPGKTNGLVEYRIIENGTQAIPVCVQVDVLALGRHLRTMAPPHFLIMEKFVLQRRPDVDLTPVKVIGVIEFMYAENMRGTTMIEHMPSNVNGIGDDLLKACHLYTKNAPHANDAARHLIAFALHQGAPPELSSFIRNTIRNAASAS
jgi:hypothetical protein